MTARTPVRKARFGIVFRSFRPPNSGHPMDIARNLSAERERAVEALLPHHRRGRDWYAYGVMYMTTQGAAPQVESRPRFDLVAE